MKDTKLRKRIMRGFATATLIGAIFMGCSSTGAAATQTAAQSAQNAQSTTTTMTANAADQTGSQVQPSGQPPSGGQAPGQSGATQPSSAVYLQSGGTINRIDQTYSTSTRDRSAILVSNAGKLTLSGARITTSGSGANGAFATGTGSTVNLTNVSIRAEGDGGHGVMATLGGIVTLTTVSIATTRGSAAPVATDRGSGTVTVDGGTFTAGRSNSPAIYSTGVITATKGTDTATGAEAAFIEGANSITLTDATVLSTFTGK